ncbi:hypothetical protein GCM10010112_26610 [Actinoplanes lobatus]|uniref:Serine/threonine protein phosphatase PrpC n=1 Tax=Actinoplanes lobatus TaxID=113568 RepID=A0A7W7HK75_9ACTN|nr:protein phosphatase 2C domain-containing protein [Actinoplanes lobatus]MBB4751702.1 serine/threonine protein phosphatase PrpC [Actinoplanes lobatus]GGN65339.1 hypothetical protein GCM10010112_26610 [Actinoplanes lobatus]GIE43285.1 hypothetical protein Alo02nite_61830 [Actinoplanes lobatus]
MSDLPNLGVTDRPWLEPQLYRGPVNTVPPALAYDGGQAGALTVRAGTVAGEQRRPWHTGNDAFAVWTDPHARICLLAVADGVGTDEAAGRAARWATGYAVKSCRTRHTPGADLPTLLRGIFGDIDASLATHVAEPMTTLTIALVPTAVPAGGAVTAAVAAVGDSTAWLMRGGRVTPLFGTRAASRPAPPTFALPGHGHRLTLREPVLHDGETLILATDGLLSGDPDERATGFLARMWAVPPTPLDFLAALGVRRPDRDDDRAAAVAWIGHHDLPVGAT